MQSFHVFLQDIGLELMTCGRIEYKGEKGLVLSTFTSKPAQGLAFHAHTSVGALCEPVVMTNL
jgi:hypothetical protein